MDSIRLVQNIINSIDMFEAEYQRTYDEIGKCDLEVCDILHDIELTSFNACEGYKMAKELQKIKQRRRNLKDQREQLDLARCTVGQLKPAIKGLQTSIKKIEEKQENQLHRMYTPRIRNDLKIVRMQTAR